MNFGTLRNALLYIVRDNEEGGTVRTDDLVDNTNRQVRSMLQTYYSKTERTLEESNFLSHFRKSASSGVSVLYPNDYFFLSSIKYRVPKIGSKIDVKEITISEEAVIDWSDGEIIGYDAYTADGEKAELTITTPMYDSGGLKLSASAYPVNAFIYYLSNGKKEDYAIVGEELEVDISKATLVEATDADKRFVGAFSEHPFSLEPVDDGTYKIINKQIGTGTNKLYLIYSQGITDAIKEKVLSASKNVVGTGDKIIPYLFNKDRGSYYPSEKRTLLQDGYFLIFDDKKAEDVVTFSIISDTEEDVDFNSVNGGTTAEPKALQRADKFELYPKTLKYNIELSYYREPADAIFDSIVLDDSSLLYLEEGTILENKQEVSAGLYEYDYKGGKIRTIEDKGESYTSKSKEPDIPTSHYNMLLLYIGQEYSASLRMPEILDYMNKNQEATQGQAKK